MSKLLVVVGATGNQGGSVVHYVLNDPELSKEFKIRGMTRDPSQPAAQALQQKGVEVVKGDADDAESLKQAMEGAHTVFALTSTVYDEQIKTREIRQGKAMADAAVAGGAKYLIWSTLSSPLKVSGGKATRVVTFDSKNEVEDYIRTLPIKSAFFAPGCFMQNFGHFMTPHPAGDGTYAISHVVTAQTQMPLVEVAADTGKYIGAVLAEPERFEGKVLAAATKLYTMEEIVQLISKVSGKTVRYKQLPVEVFSSFLPPLSREPLVQMMLFIQDYGYYGARTEELVAETAQSARGKLTTFEEYLEKNPLQLQ